MYPGPPDYDAQDAGQDLLVVAPGAAKALPELFRRLFGFFLESTAGFFGLLFEFPGLFFCLFEGLFGFPFDFF